MVTKTSSLNPNPADTKGQQLPTHPLPEEHSASLNSRSAEAGTPRTQRHRQQNMSGPPAAPKMGGPKEMSLKSETAAGTKVSKLDAETETRSTDT